MSVGEAALRVGRVALLWQAWEAAHNAAAKHHRTCARQKGGCAIVAVLDDDNDLVDYEIRYCPEVLAGRAPGWPAPAFPLVQRKEPV